MEKHEIKEEVDSLFVLVRKLEERQKRGDELSQKDVDNIKSLTLTLDSIVECMLPEKD